MSDVFFASVEALGELDKLAALHRVKRFELATTTGPQGAAHLNGNRQALVATLIDLARIGAAAQAAAHTAPNTKVSTVLKRLQEG